MKNKVKRIEFDSFTSEIETGEYVFQTIAGLDDKLREAGLAYERVAVHVVITVQTSEDVVCAVLDKTEAVLNNLKKQEFTGL